MVRTDKGTIYVIVPPGTEVGVEDRDVYTAPSLATEGFLHASGSVEQLLLVANRKFAGEPRLMVLCVDAVRIGPKLQYEEGGETELFPHIYGPLNGDAIVEVREMTKDPDGAFTTL